MLWIISLNTVFILNVFVCVFQFFIAKSWTNYTSRQTERTLAENGLSEHRIEIIADLHLQNIITN